uniref:Nuclear pore complex protein Nup153 n=1 Tax=Cynoglossus semilaevis TaxID=244447 RepID=A0A3P8WRC1_CYNSE
MTAIRRLNTDRRSDERAMAATGGGKIRSRRYHIASKPYAKSKQQQSGIISRVADTVKSIVPSWLQKYFKNEDATEEGAAALHTQLPPPPPPPPLNGSEEGPSILDGRDSPEPSTSNTEPSTSRAALNFQDYVLSRPPLSHSHLHFSPLDTSSPTLGAPSSLFSQPSTSSAPGPFSTGFSLVKEIKDNLSQHEDDNISTTSGFSSRASDKEIPASKTASLPQLWSPETDRTNCGPQPSQSSLKRPAFNLSVFGSSNSTLNSTLFNSSHFGDSPFYPGKTMYGGAAAVKSSRVRPGTPNQAPVRRKIKAKPAGAQPCGVTSATARRILQSLERMSSPLADAKRIPVTAASPLSPSLDGTNLGGSHLQSKRKAMDSTLPPVQKLVVPAAASLSGNRSVSFRPTLTLEGLNRYLDRSLPARQSTQLPKTTQELSQSTMGTSVPVHPLSSTPAVSSLSSGGGKMKRERTSARPSSRRHEENEVIEVPDLPAISLPISTSTLPTFSFSSPLPTPTTSTVAKVTTVVTPVKELFANKAGFTFSAPVAKLGPSMSNGKPVTPIAAAKKSTEDFDGPFKPAKALKQGSVLDILKPPGFASPVFKSPSGPDSFPKQTSTQISAPTSTLSSSTQFGDVVKPPLGWSCDMCWVQNKSSDTKCVACSAPQPYSSSSNSLDSKPLLETAVRSESGSSSITTNTTTTKGFGTMFSKPADTWECDTCLVNNNKYAVKCVACETAKLGTGLKPSLTLSSAFSTVKSAPTSTAPASTGFIGFGDKFKKPEGAWECDTCMIENKAEDTKCIACMSLKPGATTASTAPLLGLAEKFKKPEDSWECDVCLVQNKAADTQCVACTSPKPGATVEPKGFGSSTFGSSTSGSGGFKFGTSDSNSVFSSAGFKFGTSDGSVKFGTSSSETSSSSSGGFKFGISTETTSKDTSAPPGFKFGSSSEGFKFGVASSDDKKSEQPATGSGFKFGSTSGVAFGTGLSSTENDTAKAGFTFGLSKPEEKKSDTTTTTTTTTTTGSSVSFSPVASEEKSDSSAAPTFAFGKPEEKKDVAAPSALSSFVFGATSKDADAPTSAAPTNSGGFSFGKPVASSEQPPPSFTFGKPADKSKTSAAEIPKPTFTFGTSTTDSTASQPKPAFSFMASNPVNSNTSTSVFGSNSSDNSTQSAAPPAAPSTFMFGQPAGASGDAPPAKAFLFGQNQESQPPAPSAAPLNSTPAPSPAQPFIFGASASTNPPPPAATSTFFGAAAPSAAPSAPSAAPSPFGFNSAPTSGFGSNQAPSFGTSFGSSSFSATPPQAPAFGAKPDAPPVFGQKVNSTPVFGTAANSAPGGGFQFGGTSAFGATNNTSSVFTFGAAAPAPAPAASPSMAPQPGTPGSGFNFSQAPAFNIGSAKSFTASPAGQPGITARKIKTAVRRRK